MAIFGPLSSTPGWGRHMRPLTFLYGIQCSTTLIWSIFGYNLYFWPRRALKWIYFSFLYLTVFQREQTLELSSSASGGDRHMGLLIFLYRIQCSTSFIWRIFWYNAYFWRRRGLKSIYFAIFVFLYLHFLPFLKTATIGFTLARELLI